MFNSLALLNTPDSAYQQVPLFTTYRQSLDINLSILRFTTKFKYIRVDDASLFSTIFLFNCMFAL